MPVEKINIMIVEDEMITAMDLSTGLSREGYLISGVADNATDAVQLFEEKRPDILLMDINIRGRKDGIDTAADLLKIKKVPVIFITAYSDADTLNRMKRVQPSAFLVKPFNMINVRVAIDLAVSHFTGHNDFSRSYSPAKTPEKFSNEDLSGKELFFQSG